MLKVQLTERSFSVDKRKIFATTYAPNKSKNLLQAPVSNCFTHKNNIFAA